MNWLQRLIGRGPAPLTGAPAIRRQKTYSAQSGYVYQYFYEGYRPAGDATEYVFNVSADRKSSFPVSVLIPRELGRELGSTERYAIAKMALFAAFDEREAPEQMRQPVNVEAAAVTEILGRLGLEG